MSFLDERHDDEVDIAKVQPESTPLLMNPLFPTHKEGQNTVQSDLRKFISPNLIPVKIYGLFNLPTFLADRTCPILYLIIYGFTGQIIR